MFAFCADYTAATLFWPNHKKDIDKEQASHIQEAFEKEVTLDLSCEDSVLSGKVVGRHLPAAVIGRILIEKYPEAWPEKLIAEHTL